jgi:hypothetical protein
MFRKIYGILILALALGLTSCENYFGDINENPNSPIDASVDVILTSVEVEVADIYGGDFARYASLLTQHAEGVARQWSSANNYTGYEPANFNTAWVNTYANILQELKVLKSKSNAAGLNHYEGIANTLMAYHLMNATDVWGDMPYTEALKGTDNLQPTFDSQESLYNEIFALLSEANTLFSGGAGLRVVGSDDLIYGGNIASWTAATNAIIARGRLHLGLVDAANYAAALTAAGNAFSSASSDMNLQYTTSAQCQWYRFMDGRTGDIEFHPTYRAIMTANGDADRLALLDQPFTTSHPYFIAAYLQPMITYREVKFIEAECLMKTGGSAQAIHDAWTAGVSAAFDHFGLSGSYASYMAGRDPGVGNVTMEHIMVEKSIALYGTMEPYTDWRRTNLPALTPNNGISIPVRFPYGSDELAFNPNVPSVEVTDKLWWDKN